MTSYCDKCVNFHGKCDANDGGDCGKMLIAIIETQHQALKQAKEALEDTLQYCDE